MTEKYNLLEEISRLLVEPNFKIKECNECPFKMLCSYTAGMIGYNLCSIIDEMLIIIRRDNIHPKVIRKLTNFEEKIESIRKEIEEKAKNIQFQPPKKLTEEDIARINKGMKEYEEKIRESEKSVYRSMKYRI